MLCQKLLIIDHLRAGLTSLGKDHRDLVSMQEESIRMRIRKSHMASRVHVRT